MPVPELSRGTPSAGFLADGGAAIDLRILGFAPHMPPRFRYGVARFAGDPAPLGKLLFRRMNSSVRR